MAWVKKEDKEQLSHKEQNSQWFKLLSGGEKIMMFIVGLLVYMYLIFWICSINFSDLIFLQYLVRFAALILGAGLVTFLLMLEKIAMIEFIEAMGTPGIKDDIWKGAISVLLVVGFYLVDSEGSARFLNLVNEYNANLITDHNQDKRVSDNNSTRASLHKEKEQKIKTVVCVECKSIEANYNILISNEKRNKKSFKSTHKDNDRKYIDLQNGKVSKRIFILEEEKNNRIEAAKARFENKKDSIAMSYENRINRIDTMVLSLKSNIDSSNASEIKKEEDITRSNNRNGGYISAICMFFLCFNRWMLVKYYRASGMSWASIGDFMKGADFLIQFFTPVSIYFAEKAEKRKITNSVKYAHVFRNLEAHKIEQTNGDEQMMEFIENEISNMTSAKMLNSKQNAYKSITAELKENVEKDVKIINEGFENNLKKEEENIENTDEKAIILTLIKGYEAAFPFADEKENEYLNLMIEGYKSALTISQLQF